MRAQVRNILVVSVVAIMSVGADAQRATAPEPAQLPVRRVVLYKSGVGFFEHLGNVTGSGQIGIQFTSGQLDDALKSLTALDLDRGTISAISYNSVAPIEQQLSALRLPLGTNPNTLGLYEALRGTRVEVRSRTGTMVGRILSVERRERTRAGGAAEPVDVLTLVGDDGAVRSVTIEPEVTVRIDERDVRGDLGRYLSVIASGRGQDVRRMVIATEGTGTRRLLVSYISEVPIWKSTYRLVLPDSTSERPLLQGWAVVDNTVGEDWTNVELSLVAGAPQSFIQQISQPFYTRRAVVPLPDRVQRTPQTHESTLQSGSGTVRGIVRDGSGVILPGVTVQLRNEHGGVVAATTTDETGRYELPTAGGSYAVTATLNGFGTAERQVAVGRGSATQADLTMAVEGLQETIALDDSAAALRRNDRFAVAGGAPGGVAQGRPAPAAPPEPEEVRRARDEAVATANAQDLGDLFEYKLKQPVTIRKNQSALVPIMSAAVDAERVSVWRGTPGSGRPLRAVWLTNATGLTLDGGSFTVIEANAFAGEGIVQPLKPGEKRLVSYGTDLALTVDSRLDQSSGRFTRVTAREGVMIAQQEERNQWVYRVRNEDTTSRTVIVEHPVRPGWTIAAVPASAETTVSAARYRVTVAARGEATLTVGERRVTDTRYSIEQVDDRLIATITQRGIVSEALRQALQPVLDTRAELAAADRELNELNGQITAIGQDQQRVRQNLQVLKGSAEEKALVKRYTTELNQQEDRLATLRRQQADATVQRDSRRAELSQLIQRLTFALDSPAGPA